MAATNTLTKSDFLLYLDAPLHLWAKKHNRIEIPPSEFDVLLMNQGTMAEEPARQYITTHIVNVATGETLNWQASYTFKDYSLRADALVHKPDTDSWDLYEIKSSTRVKPAHYFDIAYQYLILSELLKIDRLYILHLSRDYKYTESLVIQQLFNAEDVTRKTMQLIDEEKISSLMTLAWKTSRSAVSDEISHCFKPKTCPCPSLCHPNLPDHSIYDIPRLNEEKKIQLLNLGIRDIKDIPVSFPLNPKQRRMVEIAKSEHMQIDHDAISTEFHSFIYPLYFLDYETCIAAIPRFPGYHPQQQVVFQYSIHRLDAQDANPIHLEFLFTEVGDPSLPFIEHLKENIGGHGTIFVWNKPFEATRNKEMAAIQPTYTDFLLSINERMYDLANFVKNGTVLHPNFKGSWSIKNVLPVMVPDLSYESLTIKQGGEASTAWWEIIAGKLSLDEVEKTRSALLEYCKLDTLAMLRIWEKLKEYCE